MKLQCYMYISALEYYIHGIVIQNMVRVHCNHYISDIDECRLGTDDCDDNAKCDNTPGSFECTCNEGYSGDGKNCDGKSS